MAYYRSVPHPQFSGPCPESWKVTRYYYREVVELLDYLRRYGKISSQCDVVLHRGVRWVVAQEWQEREIVYPLSFPSCFSIQRGSEQRWRVYDLAGGVDAVDTASWCYEIVPILSTVR